MRLRHIGSANIRLLIHGIGIAEYVFFFFAVLGLIQLRIKRPLLHRPYRAFIGIPLSFTLISFVLVVRGVLAAPVQGTFIGLLLLSGTAWHFHGTYDIGSLWGRIRYERIPI